MARRKTRSKKTTAVFDTFEVTSTTWGKRGKSKIKRSHNSSAGRKNANK